MINYSNICNLFYINSFTNLLIENNSDNIYRMPINIKTLYLKYPNNFLQNINNHNQLLNINYLTIEKPTTDLLENLYLFNCLEHLVIKLKNTDIIFLEIVRLPQSLVTLNFDDINIIDSTLPKLKKIIYKIFTNK